MQILLSLDSESANFAETDAANSPLIGNFFQSRSLEIDNSAITTAMIQTIALQSKNGKLNSTLVTFLLSVNSALVDRHHL
jgi:hypothetical protein